MKVRKHFTIDEDIVSYIKEFAKENSLSESRALEKLLKEHKDLNAKKISFNTIDRIDMNTQVLIELINCFIVNNAKEDDIILTTDITKTEILQTAEKEIERRMLIEKASKF